MRKLLLFLCFIFSIEAFAQVEDAWLFLKDKPNSTTFLDSPLMMLSQKAIERRQTLNISLDEKDVPIHTDYYNQLKNEGNIVVLGKSKWLNAIHIQGTVAQINGLPPNFPFIDHIEFANKSLNVNGKKREKVIAPNHQNKFKNTKTDFTYGSTKNQIEMLKGDFLHQQGLTGNNQIIAVIDAGFPNVNTLDAFQRIRDNDQILGGYNFADRNENFYTRNNHGTHVLSTIAGYVENEFVGSAPDAQFYLFISEIAESETVLEETLWVEAAETADSLGVNVINTSLGYTTYDNPNHSHSYADMDGKTTFISRGAEIAASRGMLLVNSVGNSGGDSWKYMGAPADAVSVISVGSVNSSRNISSFSSFGPTVDNRIKPEILAQGSSSAIINYTSGQPSTSNGTSFSSPIMAGLIACLNAEQGLYVKSSGGKIKKNQENNIAILKRSIFESADKYANPDNQYGYGIPNFENAYTLYFNEVASTNDFDMVGVKVNPNPVIHSFYLSNIDDDISSYSIKMYNILGKEVFKILKLTSNKIDISNFETGIYILKIQKENQQRTFKIIKK
jgi:hypothetical protein